MDKSKLDAEILFFFKQFRQHFFGERTGAPCTVCEDMNSRHFGNGSFFDDKSKLIYNALTDKQGETEVSREETEMDREGGYTPI